ncbi:hypothetical protein BGZ58_007321 [Dissophora ornata]|nr:hypothetical protein BGZ58_007321 [Dissophora ornata]
MDDLLGLSWDQKGSSHHGAGAAGGVKHPPPPRTSKPAHLQMGLSKTGYTPASKPAASFSSLSSSSANTASSSTPKKNADDIFGSLMPSFGQNSSDVTKTLNAMTLEERRRYDQQQQHKQHLQSLGSSSSSPGFASPSPARLASTSFSQPAQSTFAPRTNGVSSAPMGYDPRNNSGLPRTTATPTPQSLHGFASPTPNLQQPQPFQQQQQSMLNNLSHSQSPAGLMASPGGLGRSLSPAMTPLQPQRSSNSSPSTTASTPTSKDPFDALLGDQISRNSPSLKNQSLNSITPPLGQPVAVPKAVDPWDLDFLANATGSKGSQPVPATNSDVFDLGAFEKAPPEKPTRNNRDSGDALNSFIGKQPSPVSRNEPMAKPSRSSPAHQAASLKEDGDIAQIVAMGFSAERAKLALAMTENGRDIEAAIEYLVQNDEAANQLPSRRRAPSAGERRQTERGGFRDDDDQSLEDRRRRNQGQSQGRGGQQGQQQDVSRVQQLQQHKDKLVGTASVFGMSVLSKANEIYKQGREKVQAVMEDMTAEEPRSTGARRHEWVEDEFRSSGQYKDSDSEDEVYRGRREQQQQPQQKRQQQPQQSSRPRQEKENFEDTYVSSSRGGGASTTRTQKPLFSMEDPDSNSKSALTATSSSPRSTAPRPAAARAPSPLPPKPSRPIRVLVQASSQQLAESNRFKDKGNEVFKLGQFGQAAELYARAGQVLPSGHILLIVVQNNRAAALLKIGEYKETVTECDRSIQLIQGPDGQGVNDVLPDSVGVNLKDQLGKAFMRRAMAYENLEKYMEAKEDWTKLRDLEPGHRNAVEGHRRCEKAITVTNGDSKETRPSSATRKPASSQSSSSATARSNGFGATSSPMQDIFASRQQSNNEAKMKADLNRSEGVSKLRQTAAQQERDDDEKLRLTDQVDKKMTMWKSGKEDNIRALLASLGSVLWEGAAWKPVGMHELVTPAQVKIKYMRAIAKMHPDKLNSSTTIEQRMMANTIFSTLNSAWDAFKAQNNM